MALASLTNGLFLDTWQGYTLNVAYANALLGSNTQGVAQVIQVRKSGSITAVRFRTGTVTTAATMRIGLQTMDAANGIPSGTLYGGSAVVTLASPASNTQYVVTLATPATATAGDVIAVVFEFDSASGSLYIAALDPGAVDSYMVFPYTNRRTDQWYRYNAATLDVALEYSGTVYPVFGPPFVPSALTSVSYAANSSPDEYGNKIQFPFPIRCLGMRAWFRPSATGSAPTFQVLSSADAVLATMALTGFHSGSVAASGLYEVFFNASIDLTKDTDYRFVVTPGNNTAVVLDYSDVGTAVARANLPGGSKLAGTSRVNAGAWTDTTTRVVHVFPIIVGAEAA